MFEKFRFFCHTFNYKLVRELRSEGYVQYANLFLLVHLWNQAYRLEAPIAVVTAVLLIPQIKE